MFQHIDFSKTGGFPLTQNQMAFLQDAYNEVLSSLSTVIGDPAIIQGCGVSGEADGWVSFNGELLPFVGGVVGSNVDIVESARTVTYRDTGMQAVIITRKAVLGGTGTPFSSFTRITLPSVKSTADAANSAAASALATANAANATAGAAQTTANAALAAASSPIPSGMIMMWSGSQASIPVGFVLCDGANSTPNLRGRFIVGGGTGGVPVSYNPGDQGGENFHSLTVNEMPTHSHQLTTGGDNHVDDVAGGYILGRQNADGRLETHTTTNQGSNFAHENRPPYYALCFIMKT